MIGLIIAILYGLAVYFLGEPNTFPEVFLSATNFLFWWYVITSAIFFPIVLLISLGILGGGTILGHEAGGLLGGILGFLGGGALSVFTLIFSLIGIGFKIGGAYLLHHALTISSAGIAEWNVSAVIAGGVLLGTALLMGKSISFSSRSSNDD